jgi:enoyl-CoA hydratase/carnithine racemase
MGAARSDADKAPVGHGGINESWDLAIAWKGVRSVAPSERQPPRSLGDRPMTSYQQILYDTSGPVATITFNRPEKLNAWTPVMEAEVAQAIQAAEADADIRVVVLTGAGRGFCSGADLTAPPANPDAPRVRPGPDRFEFLWNAGKPLVAALNGPAAGVGLSIALHCDFRYMAQSASLTTAFALRGLIAEHGSAWLLPRLIGVQNAADLFYSGRKVACAEAAQMGLVRALPDEGFLEQVISLATALVQASSPRSLRVMRRQIHAGLDQTFAEGLVLAHREQEESLHSADFKEGITAFRERRPSLFTGR